MQVLLEIFPRLHIQILNLFALILTSGIYEFNVAQSLNPSAQKKSDIVSQEEKEFIKIKQLKVKKRSKYAVYFDMPNQMSDKKILLSTETFNKKGLLTEMIEYNSSGNVISNYTFSYDAKGRPVKAEGVDNAGRANTQTSKFDSRGYEIERRLVSIRRKRYETKSVLKYDKNGNIIEINNYENDKLNDRQKFTFDKNNIRTRITIMNPNGDTVIVSIPHYDISGKLIKEEKREGKSIQIQTYQYDSNGNLIELIDGETRREYKSDEKGNVIEYKMFLLDGRRQIRLIFKYLPNDLQSEQIRYDNNEAIVFHTAYEYEYYK